MLFLLFVAGVFEALYNAINQMLSGETDREPGDYGIGWKFCKPATPRRRAKAEITLGRRARFSMTASALTEGLPHRWPARPRVTLASPMAR